jgi:2-amino-4-hydroxy-6-hydroxymethyldihydropteridine diphosphokinase
MSYLNAALREISHQNKILSVSSVYETMPFGKKDQPDFLNAAASLETEMDPYSFFKFIKKVESDTGRTASELWGEREIDIDILFFNDMVIDTEELTIPHKGISERDFVLIPLNEVAPGIIHPLLKKKPSELLKDISEKNIIRTYPEKLKL